MNGDASSSSEADSINNSISLEWTNVKVDTPFSSREGQCCCFLQEQMYIFGGVQVQGENMLELNELQCFSIGNK